MSMQKTSPLLFLALLLASSSAFQPRHAPSVRSSSALEMGKLTVFLDKVTNLVDEDALGKSDPYVKFELEQDNWILDKDFGDQVSSKKQGDLNPEFGETFEFDELPGLENLVLTCTVNDDDPVFDDKLGKCQIELEDLGLSEEETEIDRVVDDKWICKDAKIYLKLSYVEE